ncbi:hypothetical protein CL648_02915 [bacterium]|jgi:formate dehydrogenase accessory protein FdhD|nr:hypothetical protein [bacterium]|tara:strand:- start:3077 stop:3766 length:690 start_codon:yes stop_codon:yes gene_type:complete
MLKKKIPVKSHTATHVKNNHEYLIDESSLYLSVGSGPVQEHRIIPQKQHHWISGYCWLTHQHSVTIDATETDNHYHATPVTPAPCSLESAAVAIKKTTLIYAIHAFQTASFFYKDTSITHSAAILDTQATLIASGQDLSTEHALYKAVGHWLNTNTPPITMLMISGAITQSIVQYAQHLGCYWIISRLAPTHAAYTQAQAMGIGIIGFARINRFSVFCLPPIHNAIIGS